MLHLLHVAYNVGPVLAFSDLHPRVEIGDASVQFLNLFASIVVEVVDHVLLNLQLVPPDLDILQLLLEISNVNL